MISEGFYLKGDVVTPPQPVITRQNENAINGSDGICEVLEKEGTKRKRGDSMEQYHHSPGVENEDSSKRRGVRTGPMVSK